MKARGTLGHSNPAGFTLVELLISVVVVAILMAIAIPSFLQTLDQRRLVGAADNLLANLLYAQTESIKTNTIIVTEFTVGPPWLYEVKSSPTTITNGSDYQGTTLAVTAGNLITFNPKRGTIVQAPLAAPGLKLVEITSALGSKLGLEVSPLSQMQICTSTSVGGYPACP